MLCLDNRGQIISINYYRRDSTDTQYIIIQKISQNLRNGKLISLYNNLYRSALSVFMMNNTPSGLKMHRESTEPESCQMAIMFFFSFFFFFFRWATSKLRDSFTIIFVPNSSILLWAVHQHITSSHLWNLTRQFKPVTEELHDFIFNAIFFTYIHAHKSLSNET